MICFFNRRSVFTGYPFERVAGVEARLKLSTTAVGAAGRL